MSISGNPKVNNLPPNTGRLLRDDDEVVNFSHLMCRCASSLKTIPTEDAQIFEGDLYKAEIRFPLLAGVTKYLAFITPQNSRENPLYVIWGTDIFKADVNKASYELYENATFTIGGLQQAINPNRPLSILKTAQTLLYNAPTAVSVASPAILIDSDIILGSAGTARSVGGTSNGNRFTLLLPNTKYVIKITNESADAATVFFESNFIEGLFPLIYETLNPL